MKFVADAMLGKLAKWLRALGHDTHYQARYDCAALDSLVAGGRRLLTSDRKTAARYADALLVVSNHVKDQLNELKAILRLNPSSAKWFTRCLTCNTVLEKAGLDQARENVPEYVFYENAGLIRFCPTCERYFWPGTHRQKMEAQLINWRFVECEDGG